MDNQDRLSPLPDGVLFIIVSFLPFKEAVRTSVLSRRWRRIPVGTRNLEFDERDFVPEAADSDQEARQNKRRAFLDFVAGWIGNYRDSEGPVKFGLAFSHPEDHRLEMEHFVGFATDRRVKVIDLDFSDPEWDEDIIQRHQAFLELPNIDDQHKRTLESLRLFSCNPPRISQASPNFTALKSVHLGWIGLPSAFIKNLMEKCPALETLSTKNCFHAGYFEVIGPRLKTLVLEKCSGAGPNMRMPNILINAPKLRVFKYSGVLTTFEFERLGSMEEADLDFGLHGEYGEYGDILCALLAEIACVRTLTICSYMLQVIPTGEEPLKLQPVLGCVNCLTLKTSLDRREFYGITFFLNSCPNLEVLTIDLTTSIRIFRECDPPFDIEHHAFLYAGRYQPNYTCLRSKLKSVYVEGFKGEPNELLVLRYLLKHGRVLDEVHIHLSKERGPGGASMEETYFNKIRSLKNCRVASKGLRIFLRRK
ncbi:F-box protein At3g62230-like [Coffea arabica]|uniref:F-box protein At3g62230-like n=1 Tax=Coffea arabica TaxID=13443 RepID=A0ABM4UDL4_COFAR